MTELTIGRLKPSESVIRFLVVGAAAFIVEYGTFYIFYARLHWYLVLANSLSFILGLITSFSLNRIWTFAHKQLTYSKRGAHQFSYYLVLAGINFLLTNLIVEGLTVLSVNPKIGKFIAMIVTSSWNYILFKLIIFNHTSMASQTNSKKIN